MEQIEKDTLESAEFEAAVQEAMSDFKNLPVQEGRDGGLQAANLSDELKEAAGLDVFPPDIQQDILALGQKMASYLVQLSDGAQNEGPTMTAGRRFINCWADTRSGSILRDANRNAMRTLSMTRRLPAAMRAQAIPFALAAHAGTTIGGFAGHMVGCMKRGR